LCRTSLTDPLDADNTGEPYYGAWFSEERACADNDLIAVEKVIERLEDIRALFRGKLRRIKNERKIVDRELDREYINIEEALCIATTTKRKLIEEITAKQVKVVEERSSLEDDLTNKLNESIEWLQRMHDHPEMDAFRKDLISQIKKAYNAAVVAASANESKTQYINIVRHIQSRSTGRGRDMMNNIILAMCRSQVTLLPWP
jgi:hypothetical protein